MSDETKAQKVRAEVSLSELTLSKAKDILTQSKVDDPRARAAFQRAGMYLEAAQKSLKKEKYAAAQMSCRISRQMVQVALSSLWFAEPSVEVERK